MSSGDTITVRQLTAIAFVSILAPLIRRYPRVLAQTAGRSAWLSILLALPLLAILLPAARALLRGAGGRGGCAALLTAALGPVPGRLLTGFYGLWLVFYTGFLLRSGAARLVSAVYQGASPGLFICSMALLCGVAALGRCKALARSAMLLRPLLAAAPVLLFLLSLRDADFRLLLPVTREDLLPNAWAALRLGNLLSVVIYLTFLGNRTEEQVPLGLWAFWGSLFLLLLGFMTVGCLTVFGPSLTGEMSYPFFMLARDVTVLGALERVEPVVIALWFFSDFLFLSTLLWIAAENFCFCCVPQGPGGRAPAWLTLLCVCAAAAAALLIPGGEPEYGLFSETLIPWGNAVMAVGLPLLALGAAKLRRVIE